MAVYPDTTPAVNRGGGNGDGRSAAPSRRRGASGLVEKHINTRQLPITTVVLEVGAVDTVVKRQRLNRQSKDRNGGGIRGRIKKFSRASCQRLRLQARNMPDLFVLATLTYPADFPVDGRAVKRHWTLARQFLQRYGCRKGLWFLEFQQRGAPHFHVLLNRGVIKWDLSAAWYRIVGSGDPRHLAAGTRIETLRFQEAAAAYAGKYATKAEQKAVPEGYANVGRFWGAWGDRGTWTEHTLPRNASSTALRLLRRLYKAKRKTWRSTRKTFKDKGHVGYTAWSVGAKDIGKILDAAARIDAAKGSDNMESLFARGRNHEPTTEKVNRCPDTNHLGDTSPTTTELNRARQTLDDRQDDTPTPPCCTSGREVSHV